ncbi:phospholipase/carboxylesterase [Purpureocillium lilacinum]|uniref:Acyl-protein thioesterase 1 n=2 Tax=Purpureocillium lilacinum TaxID=33203 RepID=A0A179GUT2_PURLI|nr:phospholipase/carboxylesterase [Purpureocillium lilacinum]OAQ81021.1 phospholipase/carboxylesterase [Purpureocillium lilacinum]
MLNLRLVFAFGLILPAAAFLLSFFFPQLLDFSATQSSSPESSTTATTSSSTMSSVRRAAPLIFPAKGRHTATVIFAHGLGDSGAGWADAVERWRQRQNLSEVKFILPNAPVIPITVNNGYPMPGWFDITSLGAAITSIEAKLNEDTAGILESRKYLHSLIQDEVAAGIPSERVILGGFSQGGAMSIFAGLTAPFKIAGIVGMSSWLLLHQTFKQHVPEDDVNKGTPVLMAHGDRDQMVRYPLAQGSERLLKAMGYDVTLKTYSGMEHSACLEELDEVEAFIKARLPPKGN